MGSIKDEVMKRQQFLEELFARASPFEVYDEIIAVAAYIRTRYGVVFMSKEGKSSVFARFTVKSSKDDTDGKAVSLYVLFPDGQQHKYVRFMVYVEIYPGKTAKFVGLSVPQVFGLLEDLQVKTSYINRLQGIEERQSATQE